LLYVNSTNITTYSDHLSWSITYIRSIYSKIWFFLLVFPYVSGWYVVLKFNYVPKSSWKLVHKFPVNTDPQSDIIFLGTPCNIIILLTKILAMSSAWHVVWTRIKCALFVKVSTTTKIESCLLAVNGNQIIKSIDKTSHFDSWIICGYRNTTVCLCSTFICWHWRHIIT
jgi:hypothetical protein